MTKTKVTFPKITRPRITLTILGVLYFSVLLWIVMLMINRPTADLKAVAEGESKWNKEKIQNYTITLKMSNELFYRTVKTVIRQGVIVESSEDCVMTRSYCEAHPVPKFTIPMLFEEVKRKTTTYDSFYIEEVDLDNTYGYPKLIRLGHPTSGYSDDDYTIDVQMTLD